MGTGIAQAAAQAGCTAILYDREPERAAAGLAHIKESLDRQAGRGRISREEAAAVRERVSAAGSLAPAEQADLILEAVYEDLELKQEIFRQAEDIAREDAMLATNTSTLSVTAISRDLKRAERFVGLHFFNPATAMKLLEIVPGLRTAPDTVEAARGWGRKLGKEVIVANDTPGFIVNRLLHVMVNEAVHLLQEGVAPEDIDKGMKYGLNHPMGPLELSDFAGVDLLLTCMETYCREFQDQKYRPAVLLRRMVAAGWNGKQCGRGFYEYTTE